MDDGSSWIQRTVMRSVVMYLVNVYRKNPERGVSDHNDGCAGRTVVGVMAVVSVRRRTLRKFLETLIRGVSDHHDGRAGWTVVRMTVLHKSPS